ncbi:hypothetical protein, partial [Salinivibrio socompensis]|uniref:hypothetical protein n=1 Tax=Salinivibrio socompensis TaxID=1510206 RepID=UPI000568E75F
DRNGQQLDIGKLQEWLACPVLTVTACQADSVATFRHQLAHIVTHLPYCDAMQLNYGEHIEAWSNPILVPRLQARRQHK